jgi:hypothetical protein
VNAADNKQRAPEMSRIDVTIDSEAGSIRVWNNGKGIPVEIHKEYNIYVPELIFGNLLTGSNFDDKEQKTTGGRNGYGSKLANIFSTKFIVETQDKKSGLSYKQTFTNNMQNKGEPVVASSTKEDFTCITFYPDLARFNMTHLDEDIVSLLSKRVYDVAGTDSRAPLLSCLPVLLFPRCYLVVFLLPCSRDFLPLCSLGHLLPEIDCLAIPQLLRCDRLAIALRFRSDCFAIVQRLYSYCAAIAQRLRSDLAAI